MKSREVTVRLGGLDPPGLAEALVTNLTARTSCLDCWIEEDDGAGRVTLVAEVAHGSTPADRTVRGALMIRGALLEEEGKAAKVAAWAA